MKIFVSSLTFCLVTFYAVSQPTWNITHDSLGKFEFCRNVEIQGDTSILTLSIGNFNQNGSGQDIFLRRHNLDGQYLNGKAYGVLNRDVYNTFGSLLLLSSNSFITSGTVQYADTSVWGGVQTNYYFARHDIMGDTIWFKQFQNVLFEYVRGTALLQSNAIVATGIKYLNNQSFNYEQIYLVKLDSLGNKLWEKMWGNPNEHEQGLIVDELPNGDLVIAGIYEPAGQDPFNKKWHNFLIKTDSAGNEIWRKNIHTGEGSCVNDMVVTSDGNILLVHTSRNDITPSIRAMTVSKYDLNGNIIWSTEYESTKRLCGYHFIEDTDGSIIGTCGINWGNTGDKDGMVFKLSSTGQKLWERVYDQNPNEDDYMNDVVIAPDGGIVIAGVTKNPTQDLWLMKLDSMGCLDSTNCGVDLPTGIGDVGYEMLDLELLVYPNPSSGWVTFELSFDNPYGAQDGAIHIKMIKIYNAVGQLVGEYNWQNGNNELQINVNHLPSGVYFYELANNDLVLANGKLSVVE